jgi:hypothetical protein
MFAIRDRFSWRCALIRRSATSIIPQTYYALHINLPKLSSSELGRTSARWLHYAVIASLAVIDLSPASVLYSHVPDFPSDVTLHSLTTARGTQAASNNIFIRVAESPVHECCSKIGREVPLTDGSLNFQAPLSPVDIADTQAENQQVLEEKFNFALSLIRISSRASV